MRWLISLTLILLSFVAHAHELPPLIRPASLSPVGVKLWQTLIEGNPQWRNWLDLMECEPLNNEAMAQLRTITIAVNEQLGDQRDAIFKSVVGQLFRALESDPRLAALKLDLSNPGQAVRDSFARFERGLPKEAATPYPVAHRRALNEVRQKYRAFDANRLSEDQRREIAALTWRYLEAPHPRPAYLSRGEFESWKKNYERDQREQRDETYRRLMRAELEDPVAFPDINFLMITKTDQEKLKLSYYFTIDKLPELVRLEDLPPEDIELLKSKMLNDFTLYAVWRPGVLMAFSQTHEQLYESEFETRAIYDLTNARRTHLYLKFYNMVLMRSRYFSTVKDRLIYGGARTQRIIDVVTSESFGAPYYYSTSADWMFEVFTKNKHHDEADFSFQWIPHPRKLIYAYQIASRGLEYWRNLTSSQATKNLPELKLRGDYPDDFYDLDGLPLLASSESRGNNQVDDLHKENIGFQVTRGHVPWSVVDWRLPSVQTVNTLPEGQFASGKTAFIVSSVNESSRQVIKLEGGHYALLVPAPEGFKPNLATKISTSGWIKSRMIAATDLKLRHDPERAIYLIDLGTERISNVDASIAYAVDPDWRKLDHRRSLSFTREQMAPVVSYLREIGATHLADRLELAGPVSAERLAHLLSGSGVYSLNLKNMGPDGLRGFVTAEGRFSVQCSMAATILQSLLTIALRDHPMRERVRVEISVVMPFARAMFSRPSLTTPLHAKVDVLIDGVISESLDGTPFQLEKVVNEPSVTLGAPLAWTPPREEELKLVRATSQLRAAIANLDFVPTDRSIPIFDLLHAGEQVTKAGGDLDLIKRMESWGAQLDRMAAYFELHKDQAAAVDQQTGAKVLLSKPVVAAAHLLIELSRKVLVERGCDDAFTN